MAHEKQTLGQAIDQIVQALDPLEESARKTALLAVCAHLGIRIGDTPAAARAQSGPAIVPTEYPAALSASVASRIHVDIRSLKDEKKPASAKQMACLVAYYL